MKKEQVDVRMDGQLPPTVPTHRNDGDTFSRLSTARVVQGFRRTDEPSQQPIQAVGIVSVELPSSAAIAV